jgi:hypothetical protein
LQQRLRLWRKQVGAQMMTPNPDYTPRAGSKPILEAN